MDNPVLIFAGGELIIVLTMAIVIYSLRWEVEGKDKAQQTRLLHFGAVVLTGAGLVFLLGMAMYFWAPSGGAEARAAKIFDACVTVIPPLVTLVIGYYFGQQKS